MIKDRMHGGSSRLRSPSPRRRGFSPPRRSRIGESGYASPHGRRSDAGEDRREGRYSRKDDYRRHEDKVGRDYEQPDRYHERKYGDSDYYQSPSRGGTRLSGYDDTGGRDRDRNKEGGHLRRLHQPTSSDSDRGRSFGRGGTRLSGYDDTGARDRDRDKEGDHLLLLHQPSASDSNRGRSFGRGGTRLSGYDASGGGDRDRDKEGEHLRRLHQPGTSVGVRGRSFGRGVTRLSSYDGAGGRDRDRDTEGHHLWRLHQPSASDIDRGRTGRGGTMLSGYDASGGRDTDRDTKIDYPHLYQPAVSDGDGGRSFGRGGTRSSVYDASDRRDGDRDTKADHPQRMYQPGGYGEDSQTYKYGDSTSRFQWDDLKSSNASKGNAGHWPEGSGARSGVDYNYHSSKFADDNGVGYGLDMNPVPVEAEKGRFYSSSSYQMDMGPPPMSSSQVVTAGDGLSQSLSNSLHKDENLFINGRSHLNKLASDRPLANFPWSVARGAYREDNLPLHYRRDIDMMQSSSRSKASDVVPSGSVKADREDNMSLHYRPDIDMMQSLSRSKASDVVPSGSVKADIISSSRDYLPPAEVRQSSGTIIYTGGYNDYGSNSQAKSPVDHDGRSANFRNDSLSYNCSAKERCRDYAYPTGGQVERGGVGTRSRETYEKIEDVVEDKYGPGRDSSTGTLEPIIGDAEGSYKYLRGNRLLEPPLSMSLGPRPDYYDTHNLVETSRQEVKSHRYGSPRSPRRKDSYLDHGVSSLGELNIDRQDGISWTPYKHTERLPPREYASALDNFEHRQEEIILDEEKFPKPLRTFKRRGDAEKEVQQYGNIWNDSGDAIEPWRHNMDSKFRLSNSKSAKSKFGNAKNLSNLSSQHHFNVTGSGSGPSHYSNISGHRDIKKRLGPVPKKLHVSQRLLNKYKPSLKKRLGPGPQNKDATLPPWLRKKKAPMSQRIQGALNGGFAGQGGESQEDDATQTKPQEDDVSKTKLEPPENSEEFKQMVSNAFFKFVKQLNETPARRRKYMEHIDAGSLKCIVCGSVSEEFGDTESLVVHAFTSEKVGMRSQHLGLHKAVCALMGWKSGERHESTWIFESLSRAQHSFIREDLILWPPVVIVHISTTIGNQNKDSQVIVSVQDFEEKLREMGFREKMKVHRGKPANQSVVMVVQFGATFSGLKEAERLDKMYSENNHGRDDFQLVNVAAANNGEEDKEAESSLSSLDNNSKKIDQVMYGYMGIAEDMYQLDFDTKRRCLVKSKRDIQDLAQAPLIP